MVKRLLKSLIAKLGLRPEKEYQALQKYVEANVTFVPNGHYYSPLNNLNAIQGFSLEEAQVSEQIKEIDLNLQEQKELLERLLPIYQTVEFTKEKNAKFRYYFDNLYFSYSDGIFLFCILKYVRPKRIIEIGSGFSSALILDVNEFEMENKAELTFIEPFPEERLDKLMREQDRKAIVKKFVQETELSIFSKLQANDVLFVDSSHVSKFRSDLNHILFHILPVLTSGVYIHFHDIFYPFEYPGEWLRQGRAWNEAYLIRAFLMNNNDYKVILFPSYLETVHTNWLTDNMPLTLELHEKWRDENNQEYYLNTRGQSLWIQKL